MSLRTSEPSGIHRTSKSGRAILSAKGTFTELPDIFNLPYIVFSDLQLTKTINPLSCIYFRFVFLMQRSSKRIPASFSKLAWRTSSWFLIGLMKLAIYVPRTREGGYNLSC
jgi:hypothetical protein